MSVIYLAFNEQMLSYLLQSVFIPKMCCFQFYFHHFFRQAFLRYLASEVLKLAVLLIIMANYFHVGYTSEEGVPSVRVLLKEPNPYLSKKMQGLKKTSENSERLDRRARLGSNPAPPVCQL